MLTIKMRKLEESQPTEHWLVKQPCARAPHKQHAQHLKRQARGAKTSNVNPRESVLFQYISESGDDECRIMYTKLETDRLLEKLCHV